MHDRSDGNVNIGAQVGDRAQRIEMGVRRDVGLEIGVLVVLGPRAGPARQCQCRHIREDGRSRLAPIGGNKI